MDSSRYLNYNTLIIDPVIDAGKCLEFIDLKGINLIAKIPNNNEVDIFYKDNNGNLLHGNFILGKNEKYEGSAKVISYGFFSTAATIFIRASYYKTGKYFYLFYERDNNIYVRCYKTAQGSLNEEILVYENASIKQIKNLKENYMFIIEDRKDKELFNLFNGKNGELRMLFLYENDITRYENKQDDVLNIQLFDIPFNDISENLYSVENEVDSNRGSLYATNAGTFLLSDSLAINGMSCANYGNLITDMNHQSEFTIIIRVRPITNKEGQVLFSTNNFSCAYYHDRYTLTLSNGHNIEFIKNINNIEDAELNYNTIVLSASKVNGRLFFNFGNATPDLEVNDYLLTTNIYENSEFDIDEKHLKVYSSFGVDYLAIKNVNTNLNTIKDLLICFNGDIFKTMDVVKGSFTADDIERERYERIQEIAQRSVHVIPSESKLVTLDLLLTEDDNHGVFVLYPVSLVTCDDFIRYATLYMYENSTFINNKMDGVTIYAKGGASIDANNKRLLIYHEKDVYLTNCDNCVLIYANTIYFESPQPTESLFTDDAYITNKEGRIFTETFSELISSDSVSLDTTTIAVTADFIYGNIYSVFNSDLDLFIKGNGMDTNISQISGNCTQDLIPLRRFVDLENGTILDTELNLIWSKTPIYVSQVMIDSNGYVKDINAYNVATFEIENSHIAGFTDWRMCAESELSSIMDYVNSTIVGFSGVPNRKKAGLAFSTCNVESISGDTLFPGPDDDSSSILNVSYLEDILSFPIININSNIFDVEFYNAVELSNNKAVKNDSVWVSDNRIGTIFNKTFYDNTAISGCPATLAFPVRRITPEYGVYLQYSNGGIQLLPKTKGEVFAFSNKSKSFRFMKSHKNLELLKYGIEFEKRVHFIDNNKLTYIEHEQTNSNNRYNYGLEVYLNRNSTSKESSTTVFPIKLFERFDIHKHLFTDPENNIRICNHFKQRDNLNPFKISYDASINDVVLWTTLSNFDKKIGFQYGLINNNIFSNPYDDYNVFSNQVYSQKDYYSAFHFDKLIKNNRKLIQTIDIDDNIEIMLIGKTERNTYIREINGITFFGLSEKYKSSSIIVELDVDNIKNTQSYINNFDSIKAFIEKIVKQWTPVNVVVEKIVEKETLVMAKLLQDEYVQVLVGLTPLDNFNAYYNRTVDSREVMLKSSSDVSTDQINWVGIPQLNTPYLKTGVTKIINEKKNIKITFNTRYDGDSYRAFVFSPYDAKFYVPRKDRDGFIVESSSTVRDEVSWITINSTEVINGTVSWKKGVANGDLIENNFDRILEISKHSNIYTVDFVSLGFTAFTDNNYSVIVATNKNVNVWVENKTPSSFSLRRGYVGDDLRIDFFVVRGNQKWWQGITS
jgi:hypothetical protein